MYPGVGWVVWRSDEYLPQDLIFNINYLGADQSSFTLNFSKGASQIVGQYYQLIRLGRHGYSSIMSNLTRNADYLSNQLSSLGFIILSKTSGAGLPLVAFRFTDKERHYDEFSLAHHLRSRSWVVPAYTMAPHTNQMKLLRVVVREDFSRSMCDALIHDIKLCLGVLDEASSKEAVEMQHAFARGSMTASSRGGKRHHHHHKTVSFHRLH